MMCANHMVPTRSGLTPSHDEFTIGPSGRMTETGSRVGVTRHQDDRLVEWWTGIDDGARSRSGPTDTARGLVSICALAPPGETQLRTVRSRPKGASPMGLRRET